MAWFHEGSDWIGGMRSTTGNISMLVACALALGMGGCGGGSDSSNDPPSPRAVAVAWANALNSGDGEKACSLMTPASVRELEKPLPPLSIPRVGPREGRQQISQGSPRTPCRKLMSHASGPRLPPASTTVNSQRAVVQMKERKQIMHRVVLLQIAGHWRVDFARTWDHPFGMD